jgi:glycosyltransferase involved in cell wall biosynthesis
MKAPSPVSICLPVYNGQEFVASAIQSHLDQTFGDFELIISDNASTDGTEEICRGFARKDPRVRYERSDINLGCAPNFNRAYQFVRSEYIRWAAHDDQVAPTHLAECLAALKANPDAVVAQSRVSVIDESGSIVPVYDGEHPPAQRALGARPWQDLYDPPRRLSDHDPATRFAELLIRTLWCFEIYGLMRKEHVDRTTLHGSFYGSDKVLLAELVLMGRIIEIDQPLFLRRAHAGSSMHFKTDAERENWIATQTKRSRLLSPRVSCLLGYCNAIRKSPLGFEDRMHCWAVIARWMVQWRKIARLLSPRRAKHPENTSVVKHGLPV